MYKIFLDKTTKDYHLVSENSLDYADFLSLKEQGYMVIVKSGTKKVCEKYLEEIEEFA